MVTKGPLYPYNNRTVEIGEFSGHSYTTNTLSGRDLDRIIRLLW